MTDSAIDGLAQLSLTDSTPEDELILVSCDGIKFFVNKDKMKARSGVFRDMLEVGESSGLVDEVPMAETGEMLDLVLPYWASDKTGDILSLVGSLRIWDVIGVLDKYDIEADQLAKRLLDAKTAAPLALRYLLTHMHDRANVPGVVHDVLRHSILWEDLSAHFGRAERYGMTDDGKLRALLEKRRSLWLVGRQRVHEIVLEGWYRGCKRNWFYRPGISLRWTEQAWANSEKIMWPEALERYKFSLKRRGSPFNNFPFCPLHAILCRLPTQLE